MGNIPDDSTRMSLPFPSGNGHQGTKETCVASALGGMNRRGRRERGADRGAPETERSGWGGRIRTCGLLIQSQASYQFDHSPTQGEIHKPRTVRGLAFRRCRFALLCTMYTASGRRMSIHNSRWVRLRFSGMRGEESLSNRKERKRIDSWTSSVLPRKTGPRKPFSWTPAERRS